jgi:8-oxo-dGTP diphosphatase
VPVVPSLLDDIRALAAGIEPHDELEERDRADVLAWMAGTGDLFRRVSRPVAPVRHLVSYFVVTDPDTGRILLGDHLRSGLWLPSGGHVEPGESPVETVRRECVEELAIGARFHDVTGERPLLVTVADTVGTTDVHTDVSLWFCLATSETEELTPDPGEYRSVRWWSRDEIARADRRSFDPHLGRFLDKLDGVLASA